MPRTPRKGPLLLAGALGGLTVGSTLLYAFLAEQSGQDDDLPDDLEERNYRLGLAMGVSSGVLAIGTGLSLWWAWQAPGPGPNGSPMIGIKGTW